MPLYPTSFFIPPAGVPFIVEDKYVRGGYRVAADTTERDAIAVAARKQGMLVRTMSDDTIWELVGGTSNAAWRKFDATKYIKLGAPLILNEDGTIGLDLGDMFEVDGDGKLIIDVTNLFGSFADFFSAVEADDQKVMTYNHATRSFILKTPAAGGSVAARDSLTFNSTTTVAAGASRDFLWATGKTAMLITLVLSVPDVTVECHSTAARNDANPYRFKSAVGKLSDDGISVLEDSSLQYNRRYAFLANLDTPTVGSNTYWRVINNSASAQIITVNSTYLKIE